MKKILIILIIAVFLISFFLVLSHFIDFKEWTKQTRADFGVLSVLNILGIFIFSIFGLLFLLKCFFPKCIINKYVADIIHNLIYITSSCIVLVLIIPLVILKETSLTQFFWPYSATSFIYIFGVMIICIKIFKL